MSRDAKGSDRKNRVYSFDQGSATKGYDIPAKNYYAKKKEEKKILNAWFPDTE